VLRDHVRQWVAKAEVDYRTAERLDLLTPVDPVVAVERIGMLSPFGVGIRYPGDFPELLPGQERTLFDLAKRTREAVRKQLGPHLAEG
jgi:hypothetical protein